MLRAISLGGIFVVSQHPPLRRLSAFSPSTFAAIPIALVREDLRMALASLAQQAGLQMLGAFNIGASDAPAPFELDYGQRGSTTHLTRLTNWSSLCLWLLLLRFRLAVSPRLRPRFRT